jgi:general secretion pathway protein K
MRYRDSGAEFKNPRLQSGIALVMVLWILLLVTISTSAYTLMARMDQLEAHTVMWGTRARMGAETGVNLAVLALRDPDEMTRWIADGRSYELQFQDVRLEIKVTDERGKLDVNSANETTLQQLFIGHEMEQEQAIYLAAAMQDWVDSDDIERMNGAELQTYEGNGLEVGPGNRRFVMVEELLQVLGMSWDFFQKIEPGLTVYSEANMPDPAFAPLESLLALPDMTRDDALNFIEERHSQDASTGLGATLPDGTVAMARGRGLTYSIQAKATLPNGVWDQVETTIRLGGSADGRPFRILRWREGFHH